MSEVPLYERRKRCPSAVEVWGAGTWPVFCMKRGSVAPRGTFQANFRGTLLIRKRSVAPHGPIGTFMYG
jgi:hypothetical protein